MVDQVKWSELAKQKENEMLAKKEVEKALNFAEKEKNEAYVLEQQKFAVSYEIKAGVPVPDKEDYRDLK